MARRWSARSLRNLKGVHPDLRRVFERALHETPNDFVVTEGLRTIKRQAQLVGEGASQTMNSAHLTGYAVDVAYYDSAGNIVWDWPVYDRNAATIQRIADEEGVPIQWGGDWTSLRDGPHFELHRDHYDWQAPFAPRAVPMRERAAASVKDNAAPMTAGMGAAAGALGTVVAAASDAPEPVQWALAVAIVMAAGFLMWRFSR